MATRKYLYQEFRGLNLGNQTDGTIISGVAGERNTIMLDGVPWETCVVGTQTLLSPIVNAAACNTNPALDIGLDQTDLDGIVMVPYGNHPRNPLTFIIGTHSAFFVRMKVNVADASGCEPLNVGFKGTAAGTELQALTNVWADYTDKATIGITGPTTGNIQSVTALNNAADSTFDTTDDIADATDLNLKVLVSSSGVVTYQHDVATPGTLAAPTSVESYTFDDGDYVVPFIYFANGGDVAGVVKLLEFECGYQ